MDVSRYLHILELQPARQPICEFCGNEIAEYTGTGACGFCEMFPSAAASEMHAATPDSIKQINSISDERWEEAEKLIEKLSAESASPGMQYALSQFYFRRSNQLYYGIDYNLHGYMKENSDKREASWVLLGKAKGLMYKTIKLCNDQIAKSSTQEALYTRFTAEMSLQRHRDAKATLDLLAGIKNNDEVSLYSNMVYYSTLGSKKIATKFMESTISSQPNTFYYLARHLAKYGNTRGAGTVLGKFMERSRMPKAYHLLQKIKAVEGASEIS